VLRAADRQPARLFGIITHNNRTRERWLDALRGLQVPLDHGRPRIATFAGGQGQGDLRFGQGGIFVITWASAKGLEFDSVILADINEYRCNAEDQDQKDELRRRFYVMISRARERVILLRRAGQPCPANAILPDNPNLLRHWSAK
jgi:superfamily I DNA/RNA helicase